MNKHEILKLAAENGWTLEQEQANIGLLIFVKPAMQVNVYMTTMTVGTSLDHPTKGKTQLFRRNCFGSRLAAVFKNPRVHLGTGYYTR